MNDTLAYLRRTFSARDLIKPPNSASEFSDCCCEFVRVEERDQMNIVPVLMWSVLARAEFRRSSFQGDMIIYGLDPGEHIARDKWTSELVGLYNETSTSEKNFILEWLAAIEDFEFTQLCIEDYKRVVVYWTTPFTQ